MSEQSFINQDDMRASGETLAEHVRAYTAGVITHDAAVMLLTSCFEDIPVERLYLKYDASATQLAEVKEASSRVDIDLATEHQRLDAMASTVASKIPSQAETARAHAETKKAEASLLAETKKSELSDPRTSLENEIEELDITIEAVGLAWPLAPFSEEDIEEAYNYLSDEEEAAEEDEEYTRPQSAVIDEVEREKGPHAELARSIPSLLDRLKHPESKHVHVYGEIETAKAVLSKATSKAEAGRTEEENTLCKAVYVLRTRFLRNPNDLRFLDVYSAPDIIELAMRLNKFRRKDRPDFNDVEGRILEMASARTATNKQKPSSALEGAVDRMNRDAQGRRGLKWDSLTSHADKACFVMEERMKMGGIRNEFLHKYMIDIVDRSATKPDLSWVYQFLAHEFTYDVIGRRTDSSQRSNKDYFMENCQIINDWQEECAELLGQLPASYRLRRAQPRRRNYRFSAPRIPSHEGVSALTSINNAITDIMVRRDGTGGGVIRLKPVENDPVGALKAQLRLGHKIDELRQDLLYHEVPAEGTTEEITAFDLPSDQQPEDEPLGETITPFDI